MSAPELTGESAGSEVGHVLRPGWDDRSRSARSAGAGWMLTVFPAAFEAGGGFQSSRKRSTGKAVSPANALEAGDAALQVQDVERRAAEVRRVATRRARGKLRRYCVSNGLNRRGTLTFAGDGEHDPRVLRRRVHDFFKRLRRLEGGEPFPYAWVPELHPGGHGFHVHFAVGRYIKRTVVSEAWGHGFVHMKLLSGGPIGFAPSPQRDAVIAARYLAKYIGKGLGSNESGLHRYECAKGFQPLAVRVWGSSESGVIKAASEYMGGGPRLLWRSNDEVDWVGPPSLWLSWL